MSSESQGPAMRSIAASKYGSVGKHADGHSIVRFERRLQHSVERVWAAITDPDELAAWFPEITLEPKQGGRFEIRFGSDDDSACAGGPSIVSGTIARFEPLRVLECGTMCWQLEKDGDGCILTFTDILQFDGERSEHEITNAVLAGWHWYLDALEDALEGRFVDRGKPEIDYAELDRASGVREGGTSGMHN